MNTSPAEIVYELLADLSLSSDSWPAYISFLPDTPDEAIVVYDTTGLLDGRMMRTGEQIEHYGVQIRVRGKDYNATWRKANEIAVALDQAAPVDVATVSDATYTVHNLSRAGAVIPLGIEEEPRRAYNFTINMNVTLSQT